MTGPEPCALAPSLFDDMAADRRDPEQLRQRTLRWSGIVAGTVPRRGPRVCPILPHCGTKSNNPFETAPAITDSQRPPVLVPQRPGPVRHRAPREVSGPRVPAPNGVWPAGAHAESAYWVAQA